MGPPSDAAPAPVTLWVLPGWMGDPTAALTSLPANVRIIAGTDLAAFAAAPAPDAVLNCGRDALLADLWPRVSASARWIHSLSAGVEGALAKVSGLRDSKLVLTNSRGLFARSLGEYAVTAALFFAKHLRRMLAQQSARAWRSIEVEELHGRTMGIVGFGGIGRACAEHARPFGMRILATRRNLPPPGSPPEPLVDQYVPLSALGDLLRASDYVVISAPQTAETVNLIGEPQLRAMKRTAVLINLARGPLVNEAALLRALRERWIRGAALDVFDQEPLPADHPFWGLENLLLSPHCADRTADALDEPVALFVRNLHHFVRGEPLESVVDKHAGY